MAQGRGKNQDVAQRPKTRQSLGIVRNTCAKTFGHSSGQCEVFAMCLVNTNLETNVFITGDRVIATSILWS